MEIDQSEEGDSRNHEVLRNLIAKGLPTSLAKLSGSSRIIPSEKDFHFYNNFLEFKNPVKEIDFKSKNLLEKVGASENLFGKPIMFPGDEKIELDDDVGNDWLENVNDDIYEKFDVSLDEFKVLRKKEEESGVRKMRVNVDDDSENGFQMVYGKKNKKILGLDRNVEEGGMKEVQEVKVAAKVKPKVSFHIPTIPRPQDEYKIFVNNLNQPFEHVWMDRSVDGRTLTHPLEKFSVLDFVGDSNSIVEPVKPPPIELTPFKLIEELNDLKRLAVKLHSIKEFAVDLEHNQYRSFQGLTCLMQISTRTEDFVIDTLKLRIYIGPHLRDVFKDPTKRKVMHGADRDIWWLQRDFGIYVCNMFDTGQASRVLKLERNSLEYLLNHFCGVAANKEYQNADWRLRPLPHEMLRYAREDTHYLLYIYDLLRKKLLVSPAESESSDPPLIEVYKRSYDICSQLYEKELLTDTSYLYIYGLQDAELNSEQLAIVSGLFEWRDIVARAEDESTGYVLPNRTLIEIAKQMPLTTSKLRHVLKSKHPYIERNLGSVVSIIKHCIQNASAFEEVAEYLKERRLEMATEQSAMATEKSKVLPPEAPEIMKTHEEVENIKYSDSRNDRINVTSTAFVQDENESQEIGSLKAKICTNMLEFAHCSHRENGNEIDGCTANIQRETLSEPECSIDTHANANLSQTAEATVQVLKKPSRAFGALFGNSAKRKCDPDKREQDDAKLEQIKSTVSLPFHKFLGRDEQLQLDIQESAKILEVSHHIDVAAPATGSTLEAIISMDDDSDIEESAKGHSEAASNDQLKQHDNYKAGSALDIEEGDEPMSLSDLSSHFQECFPILEQSKSSKVQQKSQLSEGFLQVKPFDYEAARKQVKFGGSCETQSVEASDDNDKRRSKRGDRKKSSIMFRSQKDEETTELPQGRRRQAFPASGNRSATFR